MKLRAGIKPLDELEKAQLAMSEEMNEIIDSCPLYYLKKLLAEPNPLADVAESAGGNIDGQYLLGVLD
jgi:hypothetical protein